MANICLDDFLGKKDSKLVDLDWLDIDPKDYDNVPFDPTPEYISVPKLEQAWDHTEDRSSFNLIPNSDLNFNYKVPDYTKFDNQKKLDIDKLLQFTKMQMMSGKQGSELVSLVKERSDSDTIRNAMTYLQKLSNEQGLLGYVYVDPSVFSKCEDGADFVKKRSKTSKYIIAMDKCSSCVFNKENRCDVYKRSIAKEVSYDKDIFDFYSKHFSNISGKEVTISSKEELKTAFIKEKESSSRVAEFKPNINAKKEEEVSLKEKEKEFKAQLKNLSDSLEKVEELKISKEISAALIAGQDDFTIKDNLYKKYSKDYLSKNKKVISSILDKKGSLGRLYIDASLLPINVCKASEAKDFFAKNAKNVKYILSNCGDPNCSCKSITSKKIINSLEEIPKEAWDNNFNSYPSSITDKLASIYSEDKIKGIRLAFVQDSVNKRSTDLKENIENFQLKGSLDSDSRISSLEKEIFFTPSKISFAINKGFPISKIEKIGKNLGVPEKEIKENIVKAFEQHISSVNKYQLDTDISIPDNVKVNISARDMSLIHERDYSSTNASVDNMVFDLDLKEASLESSLTSSKYEDISVVDLDEFNI